MVRLTVSISFLFSPVYCFRSGLAFYRFLFLDLKLGNRSKKSSCPTCTVRGVTTSQDFRGCTRTCSFIIYGPCLQHIHAKKYTVRLLKGLNIFHVCVCVQLLMERSSWVFLLSCCLSSMLLQHQTNLIRYLHTPTQTYSHTYCISGCPSVVAKVFDSVLETSVGAGVANLFETQSYFKGTNLYEEILDWQRLPEQSNNK